MSLISRITDAIFKPSRMFGSMRAQIVLEELHIDEQRITEHPVEYGAPKSDHTYPMPAELVLKMGWSNSGILSSANALESAYSFITGSGEGGFNRSRDVYLAILKMKEAGVPFDIYTGKRAYRNMLVQSVSVKTTAETENSLIAEVHCKEVLIARTQEFSLTGDDVQANPMATGNLYKMGSRNAEVTANVLNDDGSIGPQVGIR